MLPNEFTFFSVSLFLSLAMLLNWKHRRDVLHARLNKGLRGYVRSGPGIFARKPVRPRKIHYRLGAAHGTGFPNHL